MEEYFGESTRKRLLTAFTEISDLMQEHDITQIVGAGPSAQPYINALAIAHQKRHGVKLNVVSLGKIGETLHEQAPPSSSCLEKNLTHMQKHCCSMKYYTPELC